MPSLNVLLMDRASNELDKISKMLESVECTVQRAHSIRSATKILDMGDIDLVVTTQNLAQGKGTDLFEYVLSEGGEFKIIFLLNEFQIGRAVELVKLGAFDVWQKPVSEQKLHKMIKEIAGNLLHARAVGVTPSSSLNQPVVITVSRKIRKVIETAKQAASSKSTVLLTGETGSGKEIIASIIHKASPRAERPFVKINCAAIPDALLEAELFGYERGAFTGALTQKKGKIELANNGTLFLDEIGDLSPTLQAKLLHVLQHSEFDRLGGLEPIKVDVRYIAATNVNLEERMLSKQFREDLYYRLSVVHLHVPALRERRDAISILVDYFIDKYNTINEKSVESIEPYVLKKMIKYPWRGNVRELENMIERAVALSNEKVLKRHLFPVLQQWDIEGESNICLKVGVTLDDMEKIVIEQTLASLKYDRKKTAQTLGIGAATLYRKMKKYNLN